MISKLQAIVTKVEEVTDFNFTSWTSANEISAYPAFVLDGSRETFDKIVHKAHVYTYTLSTDFYVLALSNTAEATFETLKDNTVKKIFEVTGYSEIHITEGEVSYFQIGAHKVLAYHGKVELKKIVYDYE